MEAPELGAHDEEHAERLDGVLLRTEERGVEAEAQRDLILLVEVWSWEDQREEGKKERRWREEGEKRERRRERRGREDKRERKRKRERGKEPI